MNSWLSGLASVLYPRRWVQILSPKWWARSFALFPGWFHDLARTVWFAILVGLLVVITYFVIHSARVLTTMFVTFLSDVLPCKRRWIVWSVTDDGSRGAAGAVMEALDPKSNPLLQPNDKSSFPVMLIPIEGTVQDRIPVWKSLPSQSPLAVELPPDSTKNHFSLQEAFEGLDFKLGGLEAKGLITVLRALGRWWKKGRPAARGHVTSSASTQEISVRLTCSRQGDTISVYASGQDAPGVDALGLAAQRAAYKLLVRLSRLDSELGEGRVLSVPNETSIAASRQGVDIIRMYL